MRPCPIICIRTSHRRYANACSFRAGMALWALSTLSHYVSLLFPPQLQKPQVIILRKRAMLKVLPCWNLQDGGGRQKTSSFISISRSALFDLNINMHHLVYPSSASPCFIVISVSSSCCASLAS